MTQTDTQATLKYWHELVEESSKDTRPMAPDYRILHCSTEGCDSYHLKDVFSTVRTLNCEYVRVLLDNTGDKTKVNLVCNKHDIAYENYKQ